MTSTTSSSRRKLSNADAALALEQEAAEEADKRRRRRAQFGDCALVEIVHLHDCLRGALGALQRDVNDLSATLSAQQQQQQQDGKAAHVEAGAGADADAGNEAAAPSDNTDASIDRIADIERRVAGRFKVIWSVFQAHSAAEDEFIWPALQKKQESLDAAADGEAGAANDAVAAAAGAEENNKNDDNGNRQQDLPAPADVAAAAGAAPAAAAGANGPSSPCIIEQEEYEEDHANEERMFETMDSLLTRLRKGLSEQRRRSSSMAKAAEADTSPSTAVESTDIEVHEISQKIDEITHHLKEHLFSHLDKEETHCLPIILPTST